MLIGFSPAGVTAAADGATAANIAALADGRPTSITRLSGGASAVRLRLTWPAAAGVRVVGMLGLSCPVGTSLKLTGRKAGDAAYGQALGGASITQKVVELVDGSRAAWWVLPAGNVALVGIQVEIGVAGLDVGELFAHQAVDLPIEPGSEAERIDPSIVERTLGAGVNVVARRTYRRIRFTPQTDRLQVARQGGLGGGMDWERLAMAAAGGARMSLVPRWGKDGALDVEELHRTALYGTVVAGSAGHAGGNQFRSGGWVADELPPI